MCVYMYVCVHVCVCVCVVRSNVFSQWMRSGSSSLLEGMKNLVVGSKVCVCACMFVCVCLNVKSAFVYFSTCAPIKCMCVVKKP